MSGIVCAVRGGPGCQPTIIRAITLAQESGLPLYFLYVVDLDFLSSTSRVQSISEEMYEMGEFILLMIQEQSARQGVRAEQVIRKGNVADELLALCIELEADYLVMGRPKDGDREPVFTHERLEEFAGYAEQKTGATVVFPARESR